MQAKALRRRTTPPRAPARWTHALGTRCEACGATGLFALHHVTYAQHVRREHGDVWCPANSMTLCRSCHAAHHYGAQRIPADLIPDAALAFAVDLFGSDELAAAYVARYYAPARGRA